MLRIFTDYLLPFLLALAFTLALTPLVRAMNRRFGMVDQPSARRINRTPIPRGGGVALFAGVFLAHLVLGLTVRPRLFTSVSDAVAGWLVSLAFAIVALGYADDKFSLPPKVKLLGQILVAILVRAGAGIGFSSVFPGMPVVLDYVVTVFWIVGAINAFNLIDGLDGLASGLALIAVVGMGGALVFSGHTAMVGFYLVFAGGLVGFLFYNYNPASIFLGDSGSMFIGYVLALLPLCAGTPDSLVVSIGVPLLAMGVPIFDTSLAILRRTLRRLLAKDSAAGRVMGADVDHLHHRILRSVGMSQRRAAWILYAVALVLVAVGLVSVAFRAHAAGLWLVALTVGSFVLIKSLARIELYDAGRLLNAKAHPQTVGARRRLARLAVPLYFAFDLLSIFLSFVAAQLLLGLKVGRYDILRELPVMATASMFALILFRTYATIWSRAVVSNYLRLFAGAFAGAAVGTAVLYCFTPGGNRFFVLWMFSYGTMTFLAFAGIRLLRGVVRDVFYAVDCGRLVGRKDVSRILVYGAGLRYRTFRRELVRTTSANDRIIVGLIDDDILLKGHYIGGIRVWGTLLDAPEVGVVGGGVLYGWLGRSVVGTTSANDRIIVGLIDDDILLKGHYIGGIRVWGTLLDAPEVVNRLNVDAVVICCVVKPEWRRVVLETLQPTGVKVTHFNFEEKEIQ